MELDKAITNRGAWGMFDGKDRARPIADSEKTFSIDLNNELNKYIKKFKNKFIETLDMYAGNYDVLNSYDQ